ncbi:MAG: gfo/Idh/MocA family oxidoreductase, partial [Proteobacteria bacterium]|nr:gfo/Idh/MocA family oxidoreductase [Pseudomonadota bacterium]
MNRSEKSASKTEIGRRDFIKTAAGASVFMIVPRHVLGGPAYVAPSDKINIAAVGV